MDTSDSLEQRRQLLLKAFRASITREKDPWYFDEDILFFAVGVVERDDPAWLLEQFANPNHPMAARIYLLSETRETFRSALEILKREDPSLERLAKELWREPR